MIAVDTNILVYAHREDSPWHAPAAACVEGLANGAAAWALPWPCLHEFFGIVTHPRIYAPPTPMANPPNPPPFGVCESVPMIRQPGNA